MYPFKGVSLHILNQRQNTVGHLLVLLTAWDMMGILLALRRGIVGCPETCQRKKQQYQQNCNQYDNEKHLYHRFLLSHNFSFNSMYIW
jgi:hypothetical protein